MGCDGGTIPKRDELVRVKKKPEQKDKDSERQFRWLHCALTQQRLQEPIVMCGLGRLYSKQNIIEHLLEKDKMSESAKHIKSLKDIKDLNLTPNPTYKNDKKSEGLLDTRSAPYICRLIGIEMSGKFRFVGLWSCGCVFSEKALKEIKSNICSLCQTPFTDNDIVILNGSEQDTELMRSKMEIRIANRKLSKKGASIKKLEEDKPSTSTSTSTSVTSTTTESTSTSIKIEIKQENNASSTDKVSEIKYSKLCKRNTNANADMLMNPQLKRLKTDYSVAKDPKASDVYKSIFTSHKSEKEQSRAHWVTYNPFYN